MMLHIPHASRRIPADVRDQFVLTDDELRLEQLKLTDAYTDELFRFPGAGRVEFPYSRLVVDVERFPDDAREPMSRIGMGRFYTKTADGRPLRRTLDAHEQEQLAGYYAAHHQRLTGAVEKELEQNGSCLIIDCHSFPSTPLPCDRDQSQPRPDFCIGTDAFHTPAILVKRVVQFLEGERYSVEINRPYAGTIVPLKFYKADKSVFSVMMEVNRRLYMDEQTGNKSAKFGQTAHVITTLLNRLTVD